MKKIIGYCFLFLLTATLFACGSDITIKFNTNGGNEIDDIVITEIANFELPEDPVKEGANFVGWFLDKNLSNPFIKIPVGAKVVTLYARWDDALPVGSGISLNGQSTFEFIVFAENQRNSVSLNISFDFKLNKIQFEDVDDIEAYFEFSFIDMRSVNQEVKIYIKQGVLYLYLYNYLNDYTEYETFYLSELLDEFYNETGFTINNFDDLVEAINILNQERLNIPEKEVPEMPTMALVLLEVLENIDYNPQVEYSADSVKYFYTKSQVSNILGKLKDELLPVLFKLTNDSNTDYEDAYIPAEILEEVNKFYSEFINEFKLNKAEVTSFNLNNNKKVITSVLDIDFVIPMSNGIGLNYIISGTVKEDSRIEFDFNEPKFEEIASFFSSLN